MTQAPSAGRGVAFRYEAPTGHETEEAWIDVHRGNAPLLLCFPHGGTQIPPDIADSFVSPELARKDADWWIDRLYSFARVLGATTLRTRISRSVIDVNRDPSGASLYPGQATTELCPTTTFDGEPLYVHSPPNDAQIADRHRRWFEPYHAVVAEELKRLRGAHPHVVLYDAHSIRSRVPRLFEGELPIFSIGTHDGAACSPELTTAVEAICAASDFSHVLNGRFKGGWTTRHYGQPNRGIHAIQIELAMRGYIPEREEATATNWPPSFSPETAACIIPTLRAITETCIQFCRSTKDHHEPR